MDARTFTKYEILARLDHYTHIENSTRGQIDVIVAILTETTIVTFSSLTARNIVLTEKYIFMKRVTKLIKIDPQQGSL